MDRFNSTAMGSSPSIIHSGEKKKAPVEMKVVMEIFNHNQKLLERFFNDFLQNSEDMLHEIQNALEEKNSDKLKLSAHKLKGSLRYLAAEKAIACAARLEFIGKTGHLDKADDAFKDLAEAYGDIRRFLSEIQAEKI